MLPDPSQTRTYPFSSWRLLTDRIELIQPCNDKELPIYGDHTTLVAAKEWAIDTRSLLVIGVAPCAHGLLGFGQCPAQCSNIPDFDHVSVWARVDLMYLDVFLLAFPYLKSPTIELQHYARAHGLEVRDSYNWYGHGTIGIQLQLNEMQYLTPLAEQLILLNRIAPMLWPSGAGSSRVRSKLERSR